METNPVSRLAEAVGAVSEVADGSTAGLLILLEILEAKGFLSKEEIDLIGTGFTTIIPVGRHGAVDGKFRPAKI